VAPLVTAEKWPPEQSAPRKTDQNMFWLVVDLPLWKIWIRQLGWWQSQFGGKIKAMFQTTNQCFKCVESHRKARNLMFKDMHSSSYYICMRCFGWRTSQFLLAHSNGIKHEQSWRVILSGMIISIRDDWMSPSYFFIWIDDWIISYESHDDETVGDAM